MRTKCLLQIVVRPRQIGGVVAGEQTRPVTPAHLQEMGHPQTQFTDRIAVPPHGPQQSAELTPDRNRAEIHLAEYVGRLMHPSKRYIQRRERSTRDLQSSVHRRFQTLQLGRKSPFFSQPDPG